MDSCNQGHRKTCNLRLYIRWFVMSASILLGLAGCIGPEKSADGAAAEPTVADSKAKNIPVPDETQLNLPPQRFAGLLPTAPQPAAGALVPGLAIEYFHSYFFRHLDPLTNNKLAVKKGRPGKPVPFLNHQFLKNNVFDSGTNRGIAMRMRGQLRFNETGEYTFRALCNDGLRVYISERMIINDPTQHSDRYTIQALVEITEIGWYPLMIEYFQRKGTAAIKLLWRQPGDDAFQPVPAEAFAHFSGSTK